MKKLSWKWRICAWLLANAAMIGARVLLGDFTPVPIAWVAASSMVLVVMLPGLLRTRLEPVLDEVVVQPPLKEPRLVRPEELRLVSAEEQADGRVKVRVELPTGERFTHRLHPEEVPAERELLERLRPRPNAAAPFR